ncbi:hypothetical protein AA471_27270 [Salmonella enterica subsp. enterica]|nr:hypothetical protein [Salmonella enterica subsp. enterica]
MNLLLLVWPGECSWPAISRQIQLNCHLSLVKPAIVHAELKVKQMEHEEGITTWRNKDLILVLIMWK